MASSVERQAVPTRRLAEAVQIVRRRWRLRHVLAGLTIVTVAIAALVALGSLLMRQAGFSPSSILTARIAITLITLALAARYVVLPWLRRVPDERVALYVEERIPQLDGALVSAVEAVRSNVPDEVRSSALTQGLVRDATERLRKHGDAPSIDQPALQRGGAIFAAALVAAIALFTVGPAVVRQGAKLLLTPWRDAEAAVAYSIDVEPGNATIPRGTDQQVGAELHGFQSDAVELLVRRGSGDNWERVPMERGADSTHFRTRLFDLDQDAEYLVESHGIRSSVYRLTVKNLPAVKRLDLELRYPVYTGLAPEKVEDSGDIAAIAGTRAIVSVQTTMPIRGGRLVIEGDSTRLLQRGTDGVWRGELTVKRDGFYRVELESDDGTKVAGAVDYVIDALDDNAPTVRITKPGRDSRPTLTDEVLVEVQATDDFGVGKMELQYAVNGGATQSVTLQDGTRKNREVSAGHTFFLEELDLKPGDIVSYWAKASDGNTIGGAKTSTTDIYFLTIRPFGRDYRQNQQGGGGGGGGGGDDPGTLTQQQREIVAATFKTERDKPATSVREFGENVTTILMGETRLRERVEKLAQRMSRGVVQAQDSGFRTIAELLPAAAKEMATAEKALGERRTADALPPEQRALQLLERAEAVYRDVQVSQQQGGGGGGGGGASNAQDLADLFELETDKLRNQYEEVKRGNEQAASEKVDETLERLKQLAARQQQENERQRQRAQQGTGGGGGGGGQRELADQAEEMSRQLERLARERKNEQMAESARRLQEAATAMRRSAAANGDAGRASGAAALDRMERARRLLEEARSKGLADGAQDAARRAEELVQKQRDVARDVEGLAGAGANRPDKEQQLDERKQGLVGDVSKLEEDLDRIARETRRERPDASRQLQEAANAIREGRIADKIRFSRGLMRQGSPTAARNFEDQITGDLEGIKDRLASAANGAAADSSGQRARALGRARDVVRGLASIEERMKERESKGARGLSGTRDGSGQDSLGSRSAQRQSGQGGQQGQENGAQQGRNAPQGQGGQQGQRGQQGQGQQGNEPGQGGQGRGAQQAQGQGGQQGQSGQQGQTGQQAQGGQQGQGQQGQSGQQGQGQSGQQGQGQGGQPGQGQGGRGGMQPGQSPNTGGLQGGPGGGVFGGRLSPEDVRQFSRELRGQREDAEALRRELAATGRPTGDLERLISRLRALENEKALQNPGDLAKLRSSVIDGFKEFEFALRREFGDADGDRPTLGGSDEVPAGYRELVNEYFRSLARRPTRPCPLTRWRPVFNFERRPGHVGPAALTLRRSRSMATAEATVRRERPADTEHAPYYGRYITLVRDGDIIRTLEAQTSGILSRWDAFTEEQGAHRYASDKWSVRQLVGHLADAERIFVYRATRFSRADATPVPGFDENTYVANAAFDDRSLASLNREWRTVREATVAFFDGLNDGELVRRGTANGQEVSVRALAWIIAGHTIHHDAILKERYGL